MLFLLLALLAVLLPGGNNEYGYKEPMSFRLIHIFSFYNRSWTQNLLSGWLGELQTLSWDSKSGTLIFLQSWSRGNFSKKELMQLEKLYPVYLVAFIQQLHSYAHQLQVEYPFEIQVTSGCELDPEGVSVSFLQSAYQGSDFLSFQNNSWLPSPMGGSSAQFIVRKLNQYQLMKKLVHKLIGDTCLRFILGLLDAGKADLQRQVRPETWLSSGPSPGPGRLLLVCHVSGFYPKPVWVMWTRGEQEQPGSQRGDVLPNADGTWYLQVTLDVAAGEAAGLSCQVKHSSLGGQDIVLSWGHYNSLALIFLTVIVLVALLTGFAFWFWKRW
ncbi:PREDICTED: T-cell surface glycoprotein CD1a-like [Galeopterus variegatus]|uniref:T-cell surface glycoprotein CD1a-like n=1 Tax=Galeopterus variegatus TaxID=482537 RepID=A0ABM0S2G2_GALVR|nr:PREDICTED: T-cell surface glycoprotein CD1a-like [Galeopterus variegatus]